MSGLAITFYHLLRDNLPVSAAKTAIVDENLDVTYRELSDTTDRIADHLHLSGVRPGDRVIVQLRKGVMEVAAMFAVAKLGAVIVNVNSLWTIEQLHYVARDSGAACLVVEPRVAIRLAQSDLPDAILHILVNGVAPEQDHFRRCDIPATKGSTSEVKRLSTDLAMIIYTSGSTGMPKGVMLTNGNLVAGARSVTRYLGLGSDDRLLSVLPYSFDYGLNQLTTMMLVGGTVVHQPVPLPAEVIATMERQRVTGLAAVPPLWSQIVRVLAQRPRHFPALRRLTNSGGRISPNILEQMPVVFPNADIYLMYGLTEAFRSTYLPPFKFGAKKGSIGQAIPDAQVFVIKPGEGIAGPDEEGELVHRGPLVSLGYWRQPELTAQKIRPCPELFELIGNEPVVYSGDTVRMDADGDLWFIGRQDTMIKTSGFRISPDEVEDLVYRSDLVAEAVAFGMPDDDLGEIVHVAVTPLCGALDEDHLIRYCRATMPSYMVPRHFHEWPEAMPRTASGKIDRPTVIRRCKNGTSPVRVSVDDRHIGQTDHVKGEAVL